MYYILNETNQVIAADDSLLELCGVTHINELSSGIVTNEIIFDFKSDEELSIISLNGEENFRISKISLSSLLGNLTLVNIASENETTPLIDDEVNIISEEIEDEKDLISTTDDTSLHDLQSNESEEITFEDHLDIDDIALEEKTSDDIVPEDEHKDADDLELFDLVPDEEKKDDLILEESTSSLMDDEELSFELKENDIALETEELPAIEIDIHKISQIMGVSTDDYSHFLDEFIDTALGLEKDLQNTDTQVKSDAINTLSHLSDMLHLPVMGEIIEKIENADNPDVEKEAIESFYTSLSRISTTSSSTENLEIEEKEEETLELFEEPKVDEKPLIQEKVKARKTTNTTSFGTISLDDVQPKHFDFQLEEAANDLSLPVELIEEFVHDFIDQAHIETKKMLEAYEEGNLDAIQKIGHLLKGASSNLRINPLSDTLYKIQFCEDAKNLDVLIKDYWAHFLSFENQINMISN